MHLSSNIDNTGFKFANSSSMSDSALNISKGSPFLTNSSSLCHNISTIWKALPTLDKRNNSLLNIGNNGLHFRTSLVSPRSGMKAILAGINSRSSGTKTGLNKNGSKRPRTFSFFHKKKKKKKFRKKVSQRIITLHSRAFFISQIDFIISFTM